jgi:transmembrane sensor
MDDKSNIKCPDTIIDFLTGRLSSSENEELINWINQDDEHKRIFDEYRDVWQTCEKNSEYAGYDENEAWNKMRPQLTSEPTAIKARTTPGWLKYAAIFIVVLAICISGYILLKPYQGTNNVSYQEVSVPFGSRTRIQLPDGSEVWLNAGSYLQYSNRFNTHEREIYFAGEGYFDITHHKNIPFTLITPGAKIEVVGTSFNVKAYPDEYIIQTTVVRGIVKVFPNSDAKNKGSEIILNTKEQLSLQKNSNHTITAYNKKNIATPQINTNVIVIKTGHIEQNVNTELFTSWREGKLIIKRENLGSLIVKLERRYNVKIQFTEPDIKDYVFSGILEDETLEQVLKVLCLTSPIQYKIEKDNIVLSENQVLKNKIK